MIPRILIVAVLTALAVVSRDESEGGARAQLGYVASALSAGSPAEAMSAFDKSFPDYDKLSRFFSGLTAYQIQNEIEIEDELDTASEAKMTVNWILTLTDQTTSSTERRTAKIKITFTLKNKLWKIVSFAPTEIFDPLSSHR